MRSYKKLKYAVVCVIGLGGGSLVWAEPVVIEGVVPNEASKQAILMRMQSVYGANQVIDKIQVRPVAAPNGWSDSVARVITPELKKVRQGQLRVRGTQIELNGKVSHPNDIQPTTANFQMLIQQPYRFNAQLSVNQAEQKIIDDALKNRIVEFESGSAVLTAAGRQILEEMAVALHKVGGKKVKIIGHTDSSGDGNKNFLLSQERAMAVRNYLIAKNIKAENLSTEGMGSSKPVADNTTAEGRKKNRRIEFEVL
ncbi:OmpA family protein [Acinetobacter radioresistens]|uniref:OmpA family protein n=1 Tax=Acinetobacter radioresistens TaxID=40216 RepID=UPI00031DD41C|nr:OmpA family protein [Acinetobacter radioresistens]MCX0333666.1 OmpA family protein [Acinetobacter radioresistens]MDK8756247.1 OmpA family protein [Acinetobacter radioresistens]RJL73405.1 OmpA family protein [Acinetobacter radioresistens]HAD69978.1 OmpA family protein [Acinetobacter radioresistens]